MEGNVLGLQLVVLICDRTSTISYSMFFKAKGYSEILVSFNFFFRAILKVLLDLFIF